MNQNKCKNRHAKYEQKAKNCAQSELNMVTLFKKKSSSIPFHSHRPSIHPSIYPASLPTFILPQQFPTLCSVYSTLPHFHHVTSA